MASFWECRNYPVIISLISLNDGEQTTWIAILLLCVKQTSLICLYLILKKARISVWRIQYVSDILSCIDLVQIAFGRQSVLESILSVGETNICNKTNIKLSSGLYENMKQTSICRMCILFARLLLWRHVTILFPIKTFRKPLKIMQDHSTTVF